LRLETAIVEEVGVGTTQERTTITLIVEESGEPDKKRGMNA
jgi:hypothetical protein